MIDHIDIMDSNVVNNPPNNSPEPTPQMGVPAQSIPVVQPEPQQENQIAAPAAQSSSTIQPNQASQTIDVTPSIPQQPPSEPVNNQNVPPVAESAAQPAVQYISYEEYQKRDSNQKGEKGENSMTKKRSKAKSYLLSSLPLIVVILYWSGYFLYNNYGYILTIRPVLSKSELKAMTAKDVFNKIQEACQTKNKSLYAQLLDSKSSKYIKKSKTDISCLQANYISEVDTDNEIDIAGQIGTDISSSTSPSYYIFTKESGGWRLDVSKTSNKNMTMMIPSQQTN